MGFGVCLVRPFVFALNEKPFLLMNRKKKLHNVGMGPLLTKFEILFLHAHQTKVIVVSSIVLYINIRSSTKILIGFI